MGISDHLALAAISFQTLPEQLVNGLLLGSIYALIALGYTMVYGVLKLINFAHGEVYMLGAYVALFASYLLGYTPEAAIGSDPKPVIAAGTVVIVGIVLLVIGVAMLLAGIKKPELPAAIKAVGGLFTVLGALFFLVAKFQPQALNLVVMLLSSMIVCAIVGVLIERFAYRPMRNHSRIASLITAIGVSLLLQYGGALFLPNSPPPSISEKVNPYRESLTMHIVPGPPELNKTLKAAEGPYLSTKKAFDDYIARTHESEFSLSPAGDKLHDAAQQAASAYNDAKRKEESSGVSVTVQSNRILMLGIVIVLMVALTYLVMYTRAGRAMRAVSHDFDSASLMGINVNSIITFTFVIGSSLAGAGAMMIATFQGTPLTTFYGLLPGVKAFVAAVLGGIGNIPGAVLGGILMGLAETLVVWAGYSDYKDAIAFIILIVVLLFKPGGLLGSAKVEKV
jgi:branched-chain amino acid transport system permease protein